MPDLAEKLERAARSCRLHQGRDPGTPWDAVGDALEALAASHRQPSGNPGALPLISRPGEGLDRTAEIAATRLQATDAPAQEQKQKMLPPIPSPRPAPPMRLVTKGWWVYSEARVSADPFADQAFASGQGWFRRLRWRIAIAWAWHEVMETRAHIYEENLITGCRRAKARTAFGRLMSPNSIWLDGGPPPESWVNDGSSDAPGSGPVGPPPTTGSGVRAPGYGRGASKGG